jgi:hypothetical protein
MPLKKNSRNSPRKSDITPLKECIDELLDSYKIKRKLTETQIIASWEKVMGKPIAKRTVTVYIKEKSIFVKLTSAPLKHELSMSKNKIIKLLNDDLGENFLEEVIFI